LHHELAIFFGGGNCVALAKYVVQKQHQFVAHSLRATKLSSLKTGNHTFQIRKLSRHVTTATVTCHQLQKKTNTLLY